MTKSLRRRLLLTGLAASALLAVGSIVFLLVFRTPATTPLPNPNGYDDLLLAAKTATTKTYDIPSLDHEQLRALVATNAEALWLLRVGLSRRCAVPTDAAVTNFVAHSADLPPVRGLVMLLFGEGRLAEMENRRVDAVRSYIDAIRLGNEMSHGGLIIDRLVGIGCETFGGVPLAKIISKLECDQMRPLVAELEHIDESTVTWPEVARNENRFFRAQLGIFPNPLKLLLYARQARFGLKDHEERHDSAAAHLRLLTTELALRCYRCDHGSAPGSLQQLVPKYLQRAPSDPFSGHPLIYRPSGTNWLLYSVGPDRVDDGGKPTGPVGFGYSPSTTGPIKGDLLYDSPW